MRKRKQVAIIGAGVAGLSAGCYLQLQGYHTEIFEMAKHPGGLCAAWKRNDYLFDGCIRWLSGTAPRDGMYRLWEELGITGQLNNVTYFDEVMRLESIDAPAIPVYTDIDRFAETISAAAPEDREEIAAFADSVRFLAETAVPMPMDTAGMSPLGTVFGFVKNAFPLVKLNQYRSMTVDYYCARFRNPLMQQILAAMGGSGSTALIVPLMRMARMHRKTAGYPAGGSAAFVRALERRYLELGGRITYDTRAASIAVKDNRAAGIVLADGERIDADAVVSAADGYATIFKMLHGNYVDKELVERYHHKAILGPRIRVSLGVGRRFEGVPPQFNITLERPLTPDEKTRVRCISALFYDFDPSLAPAGKTTIAVSVPANYEHWMTLRSHFTRRYLMEKERVATEVIGILEKHIGNIAGRVESYDVATPATSLRHTGNWHGSSGWIPTPEALSARPSHTLPGLRRFYLAGHWTGPGSGGIASSVLSARTAAKLIVKKK